MKPHKMGYCNNSNIFKYYVSVCSTYFTRSAHFIIDSPWIILIFREEEVETETQSG